jgi:tyrosine-protein kinase Etk/Wzc
MARTNNEFQVDFLDIFIILSRWKKTIFIISFLFVSVAIVLALTVIPEYTASAVIMPKEDNMDVASSFIKNISSAKSQLKGNIFSPATDLENVYIAILKSRKLQLDVINKFDLVDVYKFKRQKYFIEDVLRVFNKKVSAGLSEEGMIVINVKDNSPKRAADIANYIVDKMDEIYGNLSVESARNRRIFLEDRLSVIKNDLANAEDSLKIFQIKNGIVDVTQQEKATIDAAAGVEAKLLAMELELNIAKKIYNADNQKIKEMENNLSEMKKQRDNFTDIRETSLLLPLKIAPDLGVKFFRLKRGLKIQEMLFELVMQQYETTKIEEAKNTPHIQILDRADPPQKRTKPKRTRMVIGAFAASLIFNFILVNFLELVTRMKRERTENYLKILTVINNIVPGRK